MCGPVIGTRPATVDHKDTDQRLDYRACCHGRQGKRAFERPILTNADGVRPRVDTLLNCQERCGRKLWRVINWQFSGDHVVEPGTRI